MLQNMNCNLFDIDVSERIRCQGTFAADLQLLPVPNSIAFVIDLQIGSDSLPDFLLRIENGFRVRIAFCR